MTRGQIKQDTPARRRYLTFFLAEEAYGIDVLQVQEIIRAVPATPVPHTPPFVLGVINLRGRVVPVVDLRVRLGMPAASHAEACIVVVRTPTGLIGALADRMHGVVELDSSELDGLPDFSVALDRDFVTGIAKHEDRLILMLDITQIMSPGEGVHTLAESIDSSSSEGVTAQTFAAGAHRALVG